MGGYIAVVDDDEGIVDVSTIVLTDIGHTVEPITNPEKLFARIKIRKPELILLDLWMPQMSGEEVVCKLRQDPDTRDIPIVVVSASKDTEKVAQGLGVNGFLHKPFNIADLENVVDQYIERD